jgi:hypothetical protein
MRTSLPMDRRCGTRAAVVLALLLGAPGVITAQAGPGDGPHADRPRAREAGVRVGVLPVGPLNAITDVAGVRVGQRTVVEGDSVRTGVTAILPHGGNASWSGSRRPWWWGTGSASWWG